MKQILLFGAGKSATMLIEYLLHNAEKENWFLKVVDSDLNLVQSKIGNSKFGKGFSFDINQKTERNKLIEESDIVISLLPPWLHFIVAQNCIFAKKNLLTASYVDENIKKLQAEVEQNNLLFLCEMGLDPGIDHMSAMQMIDKIHQQGGEITSFKSHCGGLVSPISDSNPWHYKISWNPKSVVLAGKSGASFKENGENIILNYEEVFKKEDEGFFKKEEVHIPEIGNFAWYPNRDSLSYAPLYGLENSKTFIRTTLRHSDFMKGWQKIIEFNLTDETIMYETNGLSLKKFFEIHFAKNNIGLKPKTFIYILLDFLGINDDETILNLGECSSAAILQFILEKKLALQANDKDMIVMLHELDFVLGNELKKSKSVLVVKGTDSIHTAMAKTVGLPLGIATRFILNGTIQSKGIKIPTHKSIYEPVLKELAENGISFYETTH